MRFHSVFLFLILSIVILSACTEEEEEAIDLPDCLLVRYGKNTWITGEFIDYSIQLEYDRFGKVIRRTRYNPGTNYQSVSWYDSIVYDGNNLNAIYRINFEGVNTYIWEYSYEGRYTSIAHYWGNSGKLRHRYNEFLWFNEEGRIRASEYTHIRSVSEDYRVYYRRTYEYDQGNLRESSWDSHIIYLGDTIKQETGTEQWSDYTTALNPYQRLPFPDLRSRAYSDNYANEYHEETKVKGEPVRSASHRLVWDTNEYGYPILGEYDCESEL